jgi:tRNA pseudouridine13 synthase
MGLGGFPNYFGAQRFGTLRPVTHIVGKHITLGDFKGAVSTYLGNPFPGEPEALQVARRLAEDPDRYGEALKAFPTDYTFERALLHHLTTNPGDYVGALEHLPKNLTLMFVHAYQGFLFNRILSLRISRGVGMGPVVGDRVLPVGKDGLPEHGSGIPVTEANLVKMGKRVKEGKGFVSALVIGTDAELAGGVQGEIEREVVEAELGSIDRGRFVIPEIPRLTTKGLRREILSPLKDAVVRETEGGLVLEFELNKGCYATSLLRELFKR